MTWPQGRAVIADLLSTGKLQQVTAAEDLVLELLRQADEGLLGAEQIITITAEGAYSLL